MPGLDAERADLRPLIELLATITQILPRAPSPSATPTSWQDAAEQAVRDLDLRVTWQHDDAATVAAAASREHLALTWDSSGWWVAGAAGPSKLLHLRADGTTARKSPAQLGEAARPWALLEPTFPAAHLGGHTTPWRRVLRTLRVDAADMRALVAFALVAGLLGLATPLLIQVVVNMVAFGATTQPLLTTSALLMLGLSAAACLQLIERYLVELLQRRMLIRVTADLAARLPRISAEGRRQQSPAETVNRFFDVLTAQKSLAGLLIDGLDAALQTVVGLALLAVYHPALLGYDVLLLAALAMVLLLPAGRATRTAIDESKAKHQIAGWLEEIAAQPDIFRTAAGRELALARADSLSRGWLRYRAQHFRAFASQLGASMVLQVIASTALLALGGSLVIAQQLSLGQLVAAELVVTRLLLSFAKLTDKLESGYDLVAALDKLGHVVDLPRVHDDGVDVLGSTGAVEITLDQAQLTPGGPAISARANAGRSLGVLSADVFALHELGATLAGERRVAGGHLRVGHLPIEALCFDGLRDAVHLLRTPGTVTGAVAANLSLRLDGGDLATMREALAGVGLSDAALNLGDDIGPGGVDDGTRLRLSVARLLVQRPRAVIIDRALDAAPAAEALRLFTALTASGETTVVLLTTREALARAADRAITLHPTATLPGPSPEVRA